MVLLQEHYESCGWFCSKSRNVCFLVELFWVPHLVLQGVPSVHLVVGDVKIIVGVVELKHTAETHNNQSHNIHQCFPFFVCPALGVNPSRKYTHNM